MEESFLTESITDFTEHLAGKQSVPGGGGAAALCGALGTALCEMCLNFSKGKKKYAAYEEDYERIGKEAERIRKGLLSCIDKDAKAFEPLSKAYAIPKDDPDRAQTLESATLDAAKVPQEMMGLIAQAIELLEEMEQKGSVMLLSDVACGALLCKAALESAAMNVFVNTKSLQNRAAAQAIEHEVDAILSIYVPRAQQIADRLQKKIRSV